MTIWFTSDQHFGHSNIIRHCRRPFQDVEEMDTKLLANWNSRIRPTDLVYHLGDIIFRSSRDPRGYLDRLHGKIHLIRGNHDDRTIKLCAARFESIESLRTIKIDRQKVVLCHYALRVWDASHYGSWHLYGHSHGKLPTQGLSIDIGVDSHDFLPWSWEEIEDNFAGFDETGAKALRRSLSEEDSA